MVTKLLRLNLIFISFLILSCNSTSSSDRNEDASSPEEPSGDVADINKLITTWSELDPKVIGGPRELIKLNKITKIYKLKLQLD